MEESNATEESIIGAEDIAYYGEEFLRTKGEGASIYGGEEGKHKQKEMGKWESVQTFDQFFDAKKVEDMLPRII